VRLVAESNDEGDDEGDDEGVRWLHIEQDGEYKIDCEAPAGWRQNRLHNEGDKPRNNTSPYEKQPPTRARLPTLL
jgi:hypothetical protein